jgi:hypothetical protein
MGFLFGIFGKRRALPLLFVGAVLFPRILWAFPELVRHNYVNCVSCHVSPTGGGVLTAYGRELSKEVLSTWGKEGETAFAYGLVKPPEWLNLGGDFRGLELYVDTPSFSQKRFILMQADLEASVNYKQFYLVSTLGYLDPSPSSSLLVDHLISRRHYLNYRPTDELSFRIGRFLYAFGINTPDHVTSVKRGLQLNDQGFETYNLEAAWLGERYNAYITGILGRPNTPELNRERGVALQGSVAVASSYKLGASLLGASNNLQSRQVFGPFGIWGFTPNFFLLTELDFQGVSPSGDPSKKQWGLASYARLDYEFVQGFHGYLTQETLRLDFSNEETLSKVYGMGFQFFPRPHFEFNIAWQIRIDAATPGYKDYAYALLHFYP